MTRTILPLAAMALIASACASAPLPSTMTVPAVEARAVPHIRGIATYDVALATVDAVFRERFSFASVPATIEFLPDAAPFAAALERAGYDAAFARDTAARMRAVALHRRVLINGAAMADTGWTSRVGTLAHELVHCQQYEWAGGRRGTSEQWIREGMAEWISLQTLEHLGAFGPGVARTWLLEQLQASNRRAAPRLDDMMTFGQWVGLAGRPDIAPHVQSVLAVDALVGHRGVGALVTYFRLFADQEDPEGNFLRAFGMRRAAFEAAMVTQLGLR